MAAPTLYPMMIGGTSREGAGMAPYVRPAAPTTGPRERRMRGLFEGLTALGAGLLAGGAPRVGAPAGASAFAPGLMAFQDALARDRVAARTERQDAAAAQLQAAQIRNLESQAAAREAEMAARQAVVDRYTAPTDDIVAFRGPVEAAGEPFEVAPGITAEILPPPPEEPAAVTEAKPIGQRRREMTPEQRARVGQLAAIDPAAALKLELELTQPTEIKLSDVKGIRDSYRADSKTWTDMNRSYRQIRTALKGVPTGPKDVGLLFNFMKMVDPGSVVREGEFLTIKRASALPEWIRGYVDQVNQGTILSPKQRAQVVAAADDYYREAADGQEKNRASYETLARREGIDPGRVVYDQFNRQPPLSPETLRQGGLGDPNETVMFNHPMASQPIPRSALDRLRRDPSPAARREFNELFGSNGMDIASLMLRDM